MTSRYSVINDFRNLHPAVDGPAVGIQNRAQGRWRSLSQAMTTAGSEVTKIRPMITSGYCHHSIFARPAPMAPAPTPVAATVLTSTFLGSGGECRASRAGEDFLHAGEAAFLDGGPGFAAKPRLIGGELRGEGGPFGLGQRGLAGAEHGGDGGFVPRGQRTGPGKFRPISGNPCVVRSVCGCIIQA